MKRFFSFLSFLFLLLSSCQNLPSTGTIRFVLDDGASFVDPNFSTSYITGESNTIIISGLPKAQKEGYFFVGWRENVNGSFSMIQTRIVTDSSSDFFGQEVYYYPYGSTTLYSYFEPLETFNFDLNIDKSLNPKLVEPKDEKENFSIDSASLFGYEKKSLSSKDCLPTATCTDKVFSHWAIEYPLISKIDPLTKKTYFAVNFSAEKGLYSFLDYFKSAESISFPEISQSDKTLTLYAVWIDDPLITVHLGFEERTYSFYAKNRIITDDIFSSIYNGLNDMGSVVFESSNIFFQDYEYKFIGCFLDSNYEIEFPITFPISETSLDLYILWGKKITVTFDYNGGLLNNQSFHIDTAYGYDFLPVPSSFPKNPDGFFNYYTYEGKKIYFSSFKLPNENITIYAYYDIYPTIVLNYSFPENYSYNTNGFRAREYTFPVGTDISSELNVFSSRVSSLADYTDNKIEINGFYYEKNDETFLFNSSLVPQESLVLNLVVSYCAKAILYTINSSLNYFPRNLGYFNSTQSNISLLSVYPNIKDDIVSNGSTYIFDGFYFDEELTVVNNQETFSGLSSQKEVKEIKIYRKMTKGIKLTFTGIKNGSCYIIPSSTLENNISRFCAGLNVQSINNYKFEIELDGTRYEISSILPSIDSTIIVSNK